MRPQVDAMARRVCIGARTLGYAEGAEVRWVALNWALGFLKLGVTSYGSSDGTTNGVCLRISAICEHRSPELDSLTPSRYVAGTNVERATLRQQLSTMSPTTPICSSTGSISPHRSQTGFVAEFSLRSTPAPPLNGSMTARLTSERMISI